MSRVLVVAHDAGGAEVVSAWVLRHPEHRYEYLLEGPALSIFRRKIGEFHAWSMDTAFSELDRFDWVLSGTSWANDLEKLVLREARRRAVKVVAYLEHWSDYLSRFRMNGELVFPEEVWVGDGHALALAQRIFPESQAVRLEPNLYFDEIVTSVAKFARPSTRDCGVRILYVSEPITDLGYDEFEAFAGFLDYLKTQEIAVEELRLRTHPAEPPEKYAELLKEYSPAFNVRLSCGSELAEDCAWSDWVVGCDNMAMVAGVITRKRVISCIPKGGAPTVLPYPEIEQLFVRESPRAESQR